MELGARSWSWDLDSELRIANLLKEPGKPHRTLKFRIADCELRIC